MSYIYKITNNINGMSYIGNTSYDVQKRWREHCKDSRKARCKNRPLYAAMNDYGIDNFSISILEECEDANSNAREMFWIDKLNTYKDGYNDTTGGIGKPQVDYDMVVSVYESTKNQRETARILNISRESVYKILKKKAIATFPVEDALVAQMRPIVVLDKDKKPIIRFMSAKIAAKWICDQRENSTIKQDSVRANIQKACSGKHKQAYGYFWKYA